MTAYPTPWTNDAQVGDGTVKIEDANGHLVAIASPDAAAIICTLANSYIAMYIREAMSSLTSHQSRRSDDDLTVDATRDPATI